MCSKIRIRRIKLDGVSVLLDFKFLCDVFGGESVLLDKYLFRVYRTPLKCHQIRLSLVDEEEVLVFDSEDVVYLSLNTDVLLLQVRGGKIRGFPFSSIGECVLG